MKRIRSHPTYSGAGLLPFVYDLKQPYFILFRSKKKKCYEDPGGGVHRSEWRDFGFPQALKNTAIREGLEESCGTIQANEKNMKPFIDSYYSKTNSWYRSFLYPIKRSQFSAKEYKSKSKQCHLDSSLPRFWKETDDVQYFTLSELYKAYLTSLTQKTNEYIYSVSKNKKVCRLSSRIIEILKTLFRHSVD